MGEGVSASVTQKPERQTRIATSSPRALLSRKALAPAHQICINAAISPPATTATGDSECWGTDRYRHNERDRTENEEVWKREDGSKFVRNRHTACTCWIYWVVPRPVYVPIFLSSVPSLPGCLHWAVVIFLMSFLQTSPGKCLIIANGTFSSMNINAGMGNCLYWLLGFQLCWIGCGVEVVFSFIIHRKCYSAQICCTVFVDLCLYQVKFS